MSRITLTTMLLQILLFVSLSHNVLTDDDPSINRVYSEVDESSCICGLNKQVLDRLELIVKTSSTRYCSASSSSSTSFQSHESIQSSGPTIAASNIKPNGEPSVTYTFDTNSKPSMGSSNNINDQREPWYGNNKDDEKSDGSNNSNKNEQSVSTVNRLTDEIHNLQNQLAQLLSNSVPIQQSISSQPSSSISFGRPVSQLSGSSEDEKTTDSSNNKNNIGGGGAVNTNVNSNGANDHNGKSTEPMNSGFLNGLLNLETNPSVGAWSKLNQSQNVDTNDIQSALELTIPNVVSNIFSNIQNLTIQTEHQKGGNGLSSSSNLTSIDGSSINVSGSSAAQITAHGEELFLQWIDHQLQSLHLTVSVADYIRKNALSLFRRIVKQYVERVEKMGGRVEDNVRRATQVALNNTQNLIAFLLKNYLNFAGGLMRIIGEQVSRVGKQLDSTGETIANINLNPFDIVSNVIESLPNPSRYSEYFRAVGKYLMGGSSSNASDQAQQQVPEGNANNNSNNQQQDTQRQKVSLFSKTMGALSKTLGSWIG